MSECDLCNNQTCTDPECVITEFADFGNINAERTIVLLRLARLGAAVEAMPDWEDENGENFTLLSLQCSGTAWRIAWHPALNKPPTKWLATPQGALDTAQPARTEP